MLRMAQHDPTPGPGEALTAGRKIPYLRQSGDLGLYLYRLIVAVEKLDKMARTVQPCSCGAAEMVDNAPTLTTDRADPAADVYADLCGVLAACGRVDALALVRGYCTPAPE